MTNDNTEALGHEVRELRRALKLTQDELGKRAGYRTGAGVSISRLENGQLRPSAERLQGVAEALGLTRAELEARAYAQTVDSAKDSSVSGADRLEDRFQRIQHEVEARKKEIDALSEAFDRARKRAHSEFLTKFLEVAARIEGAQNPGETEFEDGGAGQFKTTSEGVARLLSGGVGGTATGLAISLLRSVAVAAGSVGGAKGLSGMVAVPALLLAAGGAVWMLKRDRKQQQELADKLDLAEIELSTAEPSFETLRNILPRATEILDYIAVHGGHALTRWENRIGSGPMALERLDEGDRHRYQEFVDIAAAQIMVLTIDIQGLVTPNHRDELDLLTTKADAALTQSQNAVQARV